MKIAICDDDALELQKIEKAVREFILSKQADREITLTTFLSGPELLNFIAGKTNFDLLVLDIIMPEMTGIEVATEIRKTNNDCKIVFLTSSPEFAVNSYKVDAFYYLLKPFEDRELLSLLEKALNTLQVEQSNSVVISGKTGLTRIPVHTIEYVESVKHILNFHLRGGEVAACYAKMEEFRDALLSDGRFIQCHQSFIVNMNCIAKATNQNFFLTDKTLIPISRAVYPQVKQSYINYFFKKGSVS